MRSKLWKRFLALVRSPYFTSRRLMTATVGKRYTMNYFRKEQLQIGLSYLSMLMTRRAGRAQSLAIWSRDVMQFRLNSIALSFLNFLSILRTEDYMMNQNTIYSNLIFQTVSQYLLSLRTASQLFPKINRTVQSSISACPPVMQLFFNKSFFKLFCFYNSSTLCFYSYHCLTISFSTSELSYYSYSLRGELALEFYFCFSLSFYFYFFEGFPSSILRECKYLWRFRYYYLLQQGLSQSVNSFKLLSFVNQHVSIFFISILLFERNNFSKNVKCLICSIKLILLDFKFSSVSCVM